MKKQVTMGLLAVCCAAVAQGQVRSIKPETVVVLPVATYEEYERVFDRCESGTATAAEKRRREELSVYDDLYSGYCSWYCGGEVQRVTASSSLKGDKTYSYEAQNAHDFNHERVWAEGVAGQGIGEYLRYEFLGSCPRITTVCIMNGHVKSDRAWRNNSRPKRLKMFYNDEPYAILELEDSRTLQSFDVGVLGYHDEQAPDWSLKFEIMEVYSGEKYDDTVIAELYFGGIDVH